MEHQHHIVRVPEWPNGQDSSCPLQGVQLPFLAGELRCHMAETKNTNKQTRKQKYLWCKKSYLKHLQNHYGTHEIENFIREKYHVFQYILRINKTVFTLMLSRLRPPGAGVWETCCSMGRDFVFGVLRRDDDPLLQSPIRSLQPLKVRKDRPTSHLKLVTEVYPHS